MILLDNGTFFIEAYGGHRDMGRSSGRLVRRLDAKRKKVVGVFQEDEQDGWCAYLLDFLHKDEPVTRTIVHGVQRLEAIRVLWVNRGR